MSSIFALPYELLDHIVSFLWFEPWSSLRLTCKKISLHVTPLIFRTLNIWLVEGPLQNLLNIAQSPHLSRHVKHITFGLDEVYDLEFSTFARHIYGEDTLTRDVYSGVGPFYTGEELSQRYHQCLASYRTYQKSMYRQRRLERSGEFVALMSAAFASLPPMVSIQIEDRPQTWCSEPRGQRQLQTLIRALSGASYKLENLTLRLDKRRRGSRGGLLSPLDWSNEKLATAAFAHLKFLDLQLKETDFLAYQRMPTQQLSVSTIIQAATNLEDLRIELPDLWGKDGQGPGATLIDLTGSRKIGHLRTVTLESIDIRQHELTHFLETSCTELYRLRLIHARLLDGQWEDVFLTLRRFHLEHVDLHHLQWYTDEGDCLSLLSDHASAKAQAAFLCNHTEVNPWPQMFQDKQDYHRTLLEVDQCSDEKASMLASLPLDPLTDM